MGQILHLCFLRLNISSLCRSQRRPSELMALQALHNIFKTNIMSTSSFTSSIVNSDIIFFAFLDFSIVSIGYFPRRPLIYWVIAAGVTSILTAASIGFKPWLYTNSLATITLIAGKICVTTTIHGGFKLSPCLTALTLYIILFLFIFNSVKKQKRWIKW